MSIRVTPRLHARAQLPLIRVRTREAELAIAPDEAKRLAVDFNVSPVFPLPVPYGTPAEKQRDEYFQGTPIDELFAHLESLALPPGSAFVDCGSGLGNACFTAAAFFDRVTGFESNPRIFRLAEDIRQEFAITNVSFYRWDFIDVSLAPFNVVYFFRPFSREDYGQLMREKLLDTYPGTVIISHGPFEKELLDRKNFDFLEPLASWEWTPRTPYLPLAKFYTFLRK